MDSSTFKKGETSFDAEVVSESPVKVLSCTKVPDLYTMLSTLIDHGKMEFKAYDENNADLMTVINNHIKHRIERFNVLDNRFSKTYSFCCEKFPAIVSELITSKRDNASKNNLTNKTARKTPQKEVLLRKIRQRSNYLEERDI